MSFKFGINNINKITRVVQEKGFLRKISRQYFTGVRQTDYGDVTARKDLRKDRNCKSFRYVVISDIKHSALD